MPAFLDETEKKAPTRAERLGASTRAYPNHNYLQSSSMTSDPKTSRKASTSKDTSRRNQSDATALGEKIPAFPEKREDPIREALIL